MIQHKLTVDINRHLEEVFAFLTNPSNHPKWDYLSVEMEQLAPGAWQEGLRFREVRKIGGRNTEVFSRIAVFEPNKRFEIRSTSGPDFHGTWDFERIGSSTRLNYQAEMKMGGLMRLLEPLIAPQFRKQLEANFANLKRVLEA